MKLIVNESDIRIDKYLSQNTDFSRETITKMLKENYITVNEKEVKPSYKTKENDIVIIDESFIKEQNIIPTKIDLDIIYEDEYLMVINKPTGLVVHPGNGHYDNTLVNGLKYYTDNLSDISGEERGGIVHRLDKDTSGLMLVAKTNMVHELLADDFKHKRIYREYYALLKGVFPTNSAEVEAPIGRSKTAFNKMEVRSDGKWAKTNLKVLKRYTKYTLVSLVLETGRTHQIRVHMKYIGYPVFNDPVYDKEVIPSFGQFLHSKTLRFTHPVTKTKLEFTTELPEVFQEFLNKLD